MIVPYDLRAERLDTAYRQNGRQCEQLGHEFRRDALLNGDYSCYYCRMIRALYQIREGIDVIYD